MSRLNIFLHSMHSFLPKGMPGWNLRDKKGCDLPGIQNEANQPVQLLVLSDHIRDARSGELARDRGFESWDEVFVEIPWARKLPSQQEHPSMDTDQKSTISRRRMIYINAYNGDDYQNWSQGDINEHKRKQSDATDFSSWQIGCENAECDMHNVDSSLFETAKIEETAYDTIGKPKGSADAIEYFRQGINTALKSIANAERSGDSTFTYLYTAHPDKHMHALGIEHEEVTKVVKGIEKEVERFWRVLCDREALMSGQYDTARCDGSEPDLNSNENSSVDAAVVVTADHGHVTVHTGDMVTLPENIVDLLEYACIGVHGKVSRSHGLCCLYCIILTQASLLFRAGMHICIAEQAFNHCSKDDGSSILSYMTIFYCLEWMMPLTMVYLDRAICV